ncbi:MAG: hypothetical protein ABI811_17835 [Acidobacteriota bacterium]
MQPNTQEASGYFVWEVPGKPVVVHLHLDVIDRLSAEVMRGFGAVPKRGAEVGGLLLGTVEVGEFITVKVEDFEQIPCKYQRGPSFLLSEEERADFQQAVAKWQPDASRPVYCVGYFRSHTRDGLALAPEDLELMEQHFADPKDIALLIKPFATKVSVAGVFAREGGAFPTETPKEFPFRRRELTGEEAPPRRSMQERRPRVRDSRRTDRAAEDASDTGDYGSQNQPSPSQYMAANQDVDVLSPPPRRRGWMFPISFLFLVLGVALGFQAALSFAPELKRRQGAEAFALNLAAGRNGDSLTVRWDRNSPAVEAAQVGVLEIADGSYSNKVTLDSAHLHEGTVVYQNSSNTVTFRLVVTLGPNLNVTETVDWHQ